MRIVCKEIITILCIIFLAGCVKEEFESFKQPIIPRPEIEPAYESVEELKEVEVREYKGESLDTLTKFRENSIIGVQFIDIDNYKLRIDGLVNNELSLTYEEVLNRQKYKKPVTLYCVEGWDVKVLWEGVLLKDLLDQAGVKPEANTVIFYAYDGYTSSLPLDYIIDNNILLAHKINNLTLPPRNGFPFQVVAEEKWGYKWVKWITRIELSDNPEYEGTYEKVGYSKSGDLDKPKFN